MHTLAPRSLALCACLLLVAGGLVGCAEAAQPAASAQAQVSSRSSPPAERVLRYASSDAAQLDPARVHETAGHGLMLNVFEGLYTYNRGDGPPVPALATSAHLAADKRTWTFGIRKDAVWSDGRPITAEDFVWSWRRVLAPDTASQSAQRLWFIEGAEAYNSGEHDDPERVAVRALGPHTLQVRLRGPTPFFLALLADMPFVPTPRHAIEAHGAAWIRPEHIVSNGPYLLREVQRRSHAVLEKNPRYPDADDVFIERVEVAFTERQQTTWDWYEVGKIAWSGENSLPSERIATMLRSARSDYVSVPMLCTYYYTMHTAKPPFDDVRVRRAFDLAVDKQRLVLRILRGGQRVATNAVPDMFETTHGYRAPRGPAFNPDEARALLAEAGYPSGIGFPTLELIYNTSEGHRVIAEFVQRSLLENLGVRIKLANMEWKTLLERMRSGAFAIGRSSWCGDYPDPLTFIEVFSASSVSNYGRYTSGAFDGLLGRIRDSDDGPARNALLAEAERRLIADRPVLPIYHYTRTFLLRPWVLGLNPHVLDFHPIKFVRWANDAELARIAAGERVSLPAIEPAFEPVFAAAAATETR